MIRATARLSLFAIPALTFAAFARAQSAPAPESAGPTPAASAPSSAPLFPTGATYDEKADGNADLAAALKAAKRDGKRVLIDFGANWCPDCRALATFFNDPAVKPYLDARFHLVQIDVGRWNKQMELSRRFGEPTKAGLPAVVVLDRKGRIVVSTGDGSMANSRHSSADEVLALLKRWAEAKPVKS